MSPYLGVIAGYPIPIFAITLDLGLLCGLAVSVVLGRRQELPPHRLLDTAMLVLLAALVGSRAWYVAGHWGDYWASPLAILAVWEGGLALPGAVLAGALAMLLAARWQRVPAAVVGDVGGVGAALGQAIGRLGCIPAGCAAGKPAAELPGGWPALPLPDASGSVALRFPSQPIEAALELALALAAWLVWRGEARAGSAGLLYLVGYIAIRVAAEPYRA